MELLKRRCEKIFPKKDPLRCFLERYEKTAIPRSNGDIVQEIQARVMLFIQYNEMEHIGAMLLLGHQLEKQLVGDWLSIRQQNVLLDNKKEILFTPPKSWYPKNSSDQMKDEQFLHEALIAYTENMNGSVDRSSAETYWHLENFFRTGYALCYLHDIQPIDAFVLASDTAPAVE